MLEMLSYYAARHDCERHRTRRIYSWYFLILVIPTFPLAPTAHRPAHPLTSRHGIGIALAQFVLHMWIAVEQQSFTESITHLHTVQLTVMELTSS